MTILCVITLSASIKTLATRLHMMDRDSAFMMFEETCLSLAVSRWLRFTQLEGVLSDHVRVSESIQGCCQLP